MRVAFVSSGNSGISPLVKAQADSLISAGVDVQFIPIVGRGLRGYVKSIPVIRNTIIQLEPDLIHAHYSLSGIAAWFATRKPVITSLMGSDARQSTLMNIIAGMFVKWLWAATIVKSEDMKKRLGIKKLIVLPNGVNIDLFKPMDKVECQKQLGWDTGKKHIVFVSNASSLRKEKNLDLTNKSVQACGRDNLELHIIEKVPHAEIPIILNAADMLLLTSKWEGSPNIVKEAMACDIPIVATDVGDVRWLFGSASGLNLAKAVEDDIAVKIMQVLDENSRSAGRERIITLNLDSANVASRLIDLYMRILNK